MYVALILHLGLWSWLASASIRTAENNAQGTWVCLCFLCSIIHSSIPGCHFIRKYSATDIARGTSEKQTCQHCERRKFFTQAKNRKQYEKSVILNIAYPVCK